MNLFTLYWGRIAMILAAAGSFALIFSYSCPTMANSTGNTDRKALLSREHWAYEAIDYMAAQGYLDGVPEDTFTAETPITRYEMARLVKRVIDGSAADTPLYDQEVIRNLRAEFSVELKSLSSRIARVDRELTSLSKESKGVEKGILGDVKFFGDFSLSLYHQQYRSDTIGGDDWFNYGALTLGMLAPVTDRVTLTASMMRDDIALKNFGGSINVNSASLLLNEAHLDIANFFNFGDLTLGRQWMQVGRSVVLNDIMDGITLSRKMGRFRLDLFTFTGHNADGSSNNRWYGDGSGSMTYYPFSDARSIASAGGAVNYAGANTGAGLNTLNGVLTPLANFAASTDAVTFYSSPYSGSTPWDSYTGSLLGSVANYTWNAHSGIALQGGYDDNGDGIADSLAPVRLPSGYSTYSVSRTYLPYTYVAFNGILDTAGTDSQTPIGLTRDWDIRSASGLDTWGLNLAVDMGGHNLAAYYIRREFDRYDPYTSLGDPWAAMVDYNKDGIVDVDSNGRDLSPSADPWYAGLVLQGGIFRNLNYFIEAVLFDPDISNIGVDPVTGNAVTSDGKSWLGNNLDRGNAFLVGLDCKVGGKVSMALQYGVGDEEFIPLSIYETTHSNSMVGRMTPGSYGGLTVSRNAVPLMWGDVEGTGMLTGIRDLLASVSVDFTEKTKGFFKVEFVDEHDSSVYRTISGSSSLTGKPREDFRIVTLAFEHLYRPDTTLFLQYDRLDYDDDAVNTASYVGNEAYSSDDLNWGGWDRIYTGITVVY